MSLNKQLLCVSLLLLALPWAGYQYLLDMSDSLRQRQVSLLESNGRLIASAIAQSPLLTEELTRSTESALAPSLYCHRANQPIRTDGYAVDKEWSDSAGQPIPWRLYQADGKPAVQYRCSIYQDQLNLFFRVQDPRVFYSNPALSAPFNGDRLILLTGQRNYVFATAGAGNINPIYVDQGQKGYQPEIKAYWVDRMDGYQIEISSPRGLLGPQLSFVVVDQTSSSPLQATGYGPGMQLRTDHIPYYLYPSPDYEALLKPFAQDGLRIKLVTQDGWLLASAGRPNSTADNEAHWLLRQLYHRLLKQEDVADARFISQVNLAHRREVMAALQTTNQHQSHSQRYLPEENNEDQLLTSVDYIVASASPIIDTQGQPLGALVVEQSSQQTSTLTDEAFNRLFLTSALTLILVMLVMISYASWLSWRIRKLSKATRQALESQGRMSEHFARAHARDEIGTLSRDFAELMLRVDEYTDYLRDLSRKLSHELRTPLAIIHSSLDMLANSTHDAQSLTYQQRAKEGALRLGNIITAMSEARRVEESLEQAEFETVDIVQLLRDITAAYEDLYRPQQVALIGIDEHSAGIPVIAVPDLLVQMIDKLMDNAHSFCPADGRIELGFNDLGSQYQLWVSNEGPSLPTQMQRQLFDNLVSIRKESDQQHLGMGLHIVQLISAYHQGQVACRNRGDGSGVIFEVLLAKKP